MSEIFNGFFPAFKYYLAQTDYASLYFWLCLLLPAVAVLVLSKITLAILGPAKNTEETRVLQIYRILIWVTGIVSFLLVAGFLYAWATNFYKDTPLQFSHILALVISQCILIATFLGFRNKISKTSPSDLVKQPLSKEQAGYQSRLLSEKFQTWKLAAVIPFFGAIGLFPLVNQSPSLISVVIDTSSSMGEVNENGQILLESGKIALQKTINRLGENSDLILTSFEPGDGDGYKSSVNGIQENQWQTLKGRNVFEGDQKSEIFSYLSSLEADIQTGSPICETVWKNYKFTEERSAYESYGSIVSIVITDGEEIVISDVSGLFCDNPEYQAFFEEGANVNLIDLSGGRDNIIANKMKACGYWIYDGAYPGEYEASLNRILKDFQKDWFFVYWLFGVLVATGLIILGLQSGKAY